MLGSFNDFKGTIDYLSWGKVILNLEEIVCQETGLRIGLNLPLKLEELSYEEINRGRSYFYDRKV